MAVKNILGANANAVAGAKPINGKQTEYRIEGVPGLLLRVQPTGAAYWWFMYSKTYGGKRKLRRMKLGDRKTMPLKKAKSEAATLYREVTENDGDPVLDKRQRNAAMTFEQMAEAFLASGKLGDNTAREYGIAFRAHAYPIIGDMPVLRIERKHIRAVCDEVEATSTALQSDKVKTYVSGCFSWGLGRDFVEENPAIGLKKRHVGKSQRDKVPEDAEIKAMWFGPDRPDVHMTEMIRDCMRLIILTGQRRGEVAGSKVSEFDLDSDTPTWTIPGLGDGKNSKRGRMKSGRVQVVQLSKQAVDLVRHIIKEHSAGGFLFPARADSRLPYIDPHSVTKAVDRMRTKIGLDDVVIHDMRHAIGTWMKNNDFSTDTRNVVLHHMDHSVDGIYTGSGRMERQARMAWQTWADHLDEVLGFADGTSRNVRQLRRAAQ